MSEQEHQAFIVGLKLFGEVMMQHRKEELFKGFSPFQAIHGATETHRQRRPWSPFRVTLP